MSKSKDFKKLERDFLKNINQIRKLKNNEEKDELIARILSEIKTIW